MGMFDYVVCRYPLPDGYVGWALNASGEGSYLQSKDTPHQDLSVFEIRADGTLWYTRIDVGADDPYADAPQQSDYSGTIEFYGDRNLKENSRFWTLWNRGQLLRAELRFYERYGSDRVAWVSEPGKGETWAPKDEDE